jgi:hypothetical protein
MAGRAIRATCEKPSSRSKVSVDQQKGVDREWQLPFFSESPPDEFADRKLLLCGLLLRENYDPADGALTAAMGAQIQSRR